MVKEKYKKDAMTMTTEEFWDIYKKENNLEIFDIIYDFFSKELPKEFTDNYDVEEVILETKGYQEDAKNFENIIKFSELLKRKQPKLYAEIFQYFDKVLIDYYCFHKDYEKVKESFSNFIKNPTHDIDYYLISFTKLLYYGYIDILNEAITKNYKKISTSPNLTSDAGYDLAITKLYLILEGFYLNKNFDTKAFSTKIKKYGLSYKKDLLSAIETGMREQLSKEDIVNNFPNNRVNILTTLKIYFLKYMWERKFSFAISGRIWNKLMLFLDENNNKKKCDPDDYFKVNLDKYENYLVQVAKNIFFDKKPEMIAILWGSVYVYDFLKEMEIISQDTFDNFIKTTRILKGRVIAQLTSDLWRSNFVHSWEKPDSISTTEFIEEDKIFKKSINFKHQKFSKLRKKISEELANIGELSTYIIKGGKIKRPWLPNR